MENTPDLLGSISLESFLPYIVRGAQGIGILILGWIVSGWASRLIRKRLGSNNTLQVNDTLRPLFATVVKYAIMFAALYAALKVTGIPPESLLALFGAAGLAIALAMQGTLANVAAGIMLIFLRSIKVGEYISTPNVEGSVLEIGLFTAQIRAPNGILITVPNAQIWSSQINNYSRTKERRIDIIVEISRRNDLGAALEAAQGALLASPHIIKKDAASVFISGSGIHSASLQARCWITAADVLGHTSDINVAIHNALQSGGFKLPPLLAEMRAP